MADLISDELAVNFYDAAKQQIESQLESINQNMAQLQARSNELLLAHNYITAMKVIDEAVAVKQDEVKPQ